MQKTQTNVTYIPGVICAVGLVTSPPLVATHIRCVTRDQ